MAKAAVDREVFLMKFLLSIVIFLFDNGLQKIKVFDQLLHPIYNFPFEKWIGNQVEFLK